MARYHINPKTGAVGVCKAKVRCPFGDLSSDHYDTAEQARGAFERSQGSIFGGLKLSKASLPTPDPMPPLRRTAPVLPGPVPDEVPFSDEQMDALFGSHDVSLPLLGVDMAPQHATPIDSEAVASQRSAFGSITLPEPAPQDDDENPEWVAFRDMLGL